jgi:uncharacterized membrane protein YhaH (DUF805 family)
MGPVEAVRTCLSKYVTFSGRARRPEYWWWVLFGILAGIVASVIDALIGTASEDGGLVNGIVSLALLLPALAVTWRRLHDTGRSGLWFLMPLASAVPIMIGVLFAAAQMPGSADAYGYVMLAGGLLMAVTWIVIMVWLASPSEPGPNRFGPEPPVT